jgi:hypothetical protein
VIVDADFRSITYLVRLVKAVDTHRRATKRGSDRICKRGREGGWHIDIGSGILLYKHHALLTTTRIAHCANHESQEMGAGFRRNWLRSIGHSLSILAAT